MNGVHERRVRNYAANALKLVCSTMRLNLRHEGNRTGLWINSIVNSTVAMK